MNDVFGRPMDLTPQTTPVNQKPLAPCPMDIVPQSPGYVGFRPEGDNPGETGSFQGGMSESLGAAHCITAGGGDARALISATAPQGQEQQYEGAYVVPPAVPRWERGAPGGTSGTNDLGPVLPDYGLF